jgi:hypothetical protein
VPDWWLALDDWKMVPIKGSVAFAGLAVLAWYWQAGRDPAWRRWPRLRDLMLALVAALACLCWTNLGRFHFTTVYHYRELYHYYLGAKYADEVGYTRLYECTVAAEAELGRFPAQLPSLRMRDLTSNTLGTTQEILAHPERCTSHFSPERWRAFVHDADYFCTASSLPFWSAALEDNGYNATPLWTLVARLFAGSGPLDDSLLQTLGLLDFVLLAAMWAAVGWAFGWRALAVALIFWGTNFPARYWWTGGGFLRSDFLVTTALALCLVKRQRPFAGGVLLGVATLLRVFPGFVALALVGRCVVTSLRARRLVVTPAQRWFFAGAAAALLVLVPVSSLARAPDSGWRAFVENSKKHLSTPLTNNMGWKPVVAYDGARRAELAVEPAAREPYARWKQLQRDTFAHRRLLFAVGVLAYLALLAVAAARQEEDWVALVLGTGAVLVLAQLTSYYLALLALLGLLWLRQRWVGWAMAAAAWASCVVPSQLLRWDDQRYVAISALWLALVVLITAMAAWGKDDAPPAAPASMAAPVKTTAAAPRQRGARKKPRRGRR